MSSEFRAEGSITPDLTPLDRSNLKSEEPFEYYQPQDGEATRTPTAATVATSEDPEPLLKDASSPFFYSAKAWYFLYAAALAGTLY